MHEQPMTLEDRISALEETVETQSELLLRHDSQLAFMASLIADLTAATQSAQRANQVLIPGDLDLVIKG